MAVTRSHLRSLATLLAVLWIVFAAMLLVTYRPGVADPRFVLAFVPALVAAVAIRWPPRAGRSGVTGAALAVAAVVLLVSAVVAVLPLRADPLRQPLAPSAETWYAVALVLLLTTAFAGLGLAGLLPPVRAATALAGVVFVIALTVAGTAALAAALVSAPLRPVPAAASPWRPRDAASPLPPCQGAVRLMPAARVEVTATLTIDGVEQGEVTIAGARRDADERWHSESRTLWRRVSVDHIRSAGRAWRAVDSGEWEPMPAVTGAGALDAAVVANIEAEDRQLAVEDVGEELLGGVPARRCRAAVRGPGALRAFPALRPLIGGELFDETPLLSQWQGELEWWVFSDGELGVASVSLHGLPGREWPQRGIKGRLDARLVAADAATPERIGAP